MPVDSMHSWPSHTLSMLSGKQWQFLVVSKGGPPIAPTGTCPYLSTAPVVLSQRHESPFHGTTGIATHTKGRTDAHMSLVYIYIYYLERVWSYDATRFDTRVLVCCVLRSNVRGVYLTLYALFYMINHLAMACLPLLMCQVGKGTLVYIIRRTVEVIIETRNYPL